MKKYILGILSFVLLGSFSCYGELPSLDNKGYFDVLIEKKDKTNGNLGTKEKPLEVSPTGDDFVLQVRFRGTDKLVDPTYKGYFCVFSTKGNMDFKAEGGGVFDNRPILLSPNQVAIVELKLKLGFGKTSIWVGENKDPRLLSQDIKIKNEVLCSDDTPFIGVSGAAADLHYKNLSIYDVQKSDDDTPLLGKYALITEGKMIVTGVTNNGFFVTDLDALAKGIGYHSLFVFTFSAPSLSVEDGIAPTLVQEGDLIQKVEGGLIEFSGQTQMAFPSFEPLWTDTHKTTVVNKKALLPTPIDLPVGDTWSRKKIEPLETALVQIKDAIAIPFPLNQDGWEEFRQWPVLVFNPKDPQFKETCQENVLTELHLHKDASKNTGAYRKELALCRAARDLKEVPCNKETDETKKELCLETARDSWYQCFFDARFALFKRVETQCEYSVLLIDSTSTVPNYEPSDPANHFIRFKKIVGILNQVKASSFFKLTADQYPDEMSGNGYAIWVRKPSDLEIDTSQTNR